MLFDLQLISNFLPFLSVVTYSYDVPNICITLYLKCTLSILSFVTTADSSTGNNLYISPSFPGSPEISSPFVPFIAQLYVFVTVPSE